MKNDKILIVIPGFFFHVEEGAKNRINSFINTYLKAGYHVSVFFTYPVHCVKYLPWRKRYLHPDVKWFMIPSFSYFYNPLLNKLSIIIGQLFLFFLSRIYRYKFIQAEHNVGGILCRYKSRYSALIVDFHGDSRDEFLLNHPFITMKDWRLRFIKEANLISVKKATCILTVSKNLQEELMRQTCLPINDYFILPCCVDLGRFENLITPNIKIGQKRIVVGYFGGLQKWQNIEIILDIVLRLRKLNDSIFFMLITPNSIDGIEDKLNEIGSENYMNLSLKSGEIPAYLSVMDASFLIRDGRMLNIVSSPTKIAESMAAGVPIIATKNAGDINEIVETGQNGYIINDIVITDQDVYNIHEYLIKVKDNRTYYRDLCKKSVKNRVWKDISDKLLVKIADL